MSDSDYSASAPAPQQVVYTAFKKAANVSGTQCASVKLTCGQCQSCQRNAAQFMASLEACGMTHAKAQSSSLTFEVASLLCSMAFAQTVIPMAPLVLAQRNDHGAGTMGVVGRPPVAAVRTDFHCM